MGFVLDTLIIDEVVTTPTTINTTTTFDAVDISKKEDAFSIMLTYDNGSSVNMTLFVEVSVDGVTFSRIDDADQTITDDTGSMIWDFNDSGTNYMRVGIEVTAGSIDVNKVAFSQRRRH